MDVYSHLVIDGENICINASALILAVLRLYRDIAAIKETLVMSNVFDISTLERYVKSDEEIKEGIEKEEQMQRTIKRINQT